MCRNQNMKGLSFMETASSEDGQTRDTRPRVSVIVSLIVWVPGDSGGDVVPS
jgi:hypothetical protein